MGELCERWFDGIEYLITEPIISFYIYITMALAEIAFLWRFFPGIAIPFTFLLVLSILNILVCSFFKGCREGEKEELIFSRTYVIIFGILIIVGFFFNWLANIILFGIPLAVTAVSLVVREFQITTFLGKFPKIVEIISKVFRNKMVWLISQIIVIAGPFIVFCICVCLTTVPLWFKVLSVIVYALLIPLIVNFEDEWGTCTIFELAYDVTWSKEYEQRMRVFEKKMEEDPEGTTQEVLQEVSAMKEEYEKILEQAKNQNDKK